MLKTLDDFRQNNLTYMICQIIYNNNTSNITPFVYNHYFEMTVHNFEQQLMNFENEKYPPVAYQPILLSIFANCFSCLEQFISTVYFIAYLSCCSTNIPDDKTLNKMRKKEYHEKISEIFKILQADSKTFSQLNLRKKVKELASIRNYILHGNVGEVKIEKTKLPKFPLTSNYEDVMEELDIIINVIHHFRYIFPNIDLMPQISISYNGTIMYKSLDEYFYKALVPYFESILMKHYLHAIKTYSLSARTLSVTNKLIAKEFLIRINTKGDNLEGYSKNSINTKLFDLSIAKIISSKELSSLIMNNTFQLPNFMLK